MQLESVASSSVIHSILNQVELSQVTDFEWREDLVERREKNSIYHRRGESPYALACARGQGGGQPWRLGKMVFSHSLDQGPASLCFELAKCTRLSVPLSISLDGDDKAEKEDAPQPSIRQANGKQKTCVKVQQQASSSSQAK